MKLDQAFGLPKQTVRAIITLILVLPLPIAMFMGIDIPEALWALAGTAIAWYFKRGE